MKKIVTRLGLFAVLVAMSNSVAWADSDADTVKLFKDAGQSAAFFPKSYGYAVFPSIGKGGLGIGGAYGKGHVYEKGKLIGDTSVTQLSIGFQAGGQAYSQIVFFEDKRALDEFTSGNFEFGAGASAVAVTAGASANAGTTGASAGASGGKKDATTSGSEYYKGMAVFTIAKGGLMFEASISGQKFSFKAAGK
jgi:lipid-binding SYLF domain-containing protein